MNPASLTKRVEAKVSAFCASPTKYLFLPMMKIILALALASASATELTLDKCVPPFPAKIKARARALS